MKRLYHYIATKNVENIDFKTSYKITNIWLFNNKYR